MFVGYAYACVAEHCHGFAVLYADRYFQTSALMIVLYGVVHKVQKQFCDVALIAVYLNRFTLNGHCDLSIIFLVTEYLLYVMGGFQQVYFIRQNVFLLLYLGKPDNIVYKIQKSFAFTIYHTAVFLHVLFLGENAVFKKLAKAFYGGKRSFKLVRYVG